MKKTRLSLCLTSGFVVAMSLTGCSSVTDKENTIITFTNNDGKQVNVLANDIYNKYKGKTDGVSKFYNAILESLIRYEYANPNEAIKNWKKSIKSNQEIKEEAQNNVKNDKNTADENAKTNGTSYETEWQNILNSHNREDEDQLLQYYIYQLEKEDITDKFFLLNQDNGLTQEWLGIDDKGQKISEDVKGTFPYHIRHVLISLSSDQSKKFYDATVTADEAKNIGNTMEALLSDTYSFAEVAKKFSGDTGSAAKGGDAGIMSTTTSFVNEFKLGIYAFDSIYTHNTDETKNQDIKEGLGLDPKYTISVKGKVTVGEGEGAHEEEQVIDTTVENAFGKYINDGKLQEVPFDVFLKIKNYAETTKDAKGKQVNSGKEAYYPRNVLYNYYLNFHNPFVITNQLLDANEDSADSTGLPSGYSEAYPNKFKVNTTLDSTGTKKYLTDGNGHIIIGVRSEYGIHLMIMEKSIYEFTEGGNQSPNTSLEDYYTTLVPSDSEFPSYAGKQKSTYVNYIISTDASVYKTRADEVKSAIKSFDSTYDYRLYNYILGIEGDNVKIHDTELASQISEYISRTQTSNLNTAKNNLNEAWRTYAELVALQYDMRTDWTGHDGKTADEDYTTIHPRCAIGFKKTAKSDTAWSAENGVCHYEE